MRRRGCRPRPRAAACDDGDACCAGALDSSVAAYRRALWVVFAINALNFIDGLYKLAKVNWHVAWQIVMSVFYIALSVRMIQLILAFRGE